MSGTRLDRALVDRGLAPARERAKAWIDEGSVRVNGAVERRASRRVASDDVLVVETDDQRWVSRGARKLLQALEAFPVEIDGRDALDVGASTGGFTQVLLASGAGHVHAVDVGSGQLAETLQSDARVTNWEKTHVRDLPQRASGCRWSLAVVDCSFISLAKVLPWVSRVLEPQADVVALLKPQFEAGRERLGSRGVVRDGPQRRAVVEEALDRIRCLGFEILGTVDSETLGPEGNIEVLVHARWSGSGRLDGAGAETDSVAFR